MFSRLLSSLLAVLMLAISAPALSQDKVSFRLSTWLPEAHPMSRFLDRWAASLKEKSGGRIEISSFHSGQLGPVTQHYDMVRRGTVDIGFILHGANSDRFPLTGLIDIPFLVKSAAHGTRIINDPTLRKTYLDPEHRGVRVLMLLTHQPAQLFTAEKPVRVPGDLAGQRIRFPNAVAKMFLDEMGATSVGLPPSAISENLQKRVIDGLMIDYGGAGIAYKLGGMIRHATELDAYVTSFGLIMSPDAYAKLPADLQKIFDDSLVGIEGEVGAAWDSLNTPGKQAIVAGGAQVNVPQGADRAAFEAIGAKVGDSVLKQRDAAGVPATATYKMMKELANRVKP